MESNFNTNSESQQQARISRIAEGVLMLGSALIGLWLLGVFVLAFLK